MLVWVCKKSKITSGLSALRRGKKKNQQVPVGRWDHRSLQSSIPLSCLRLPFARMSKWLRNQPDEYFLAGHKSLGSRIKDWSIGHFSFCPFRRGNDIFRRPKRQLFRRAGSESFEDDTSCRAVLSFKIPLQHVKENLLIPRSILQLALYVTASSDFASGLKIK